MKVFLVTGSKMIKQDTKVFSNSSMMLSGFLMKMNIAGLFDVFEVGSFSVAAAAKAKAKVMEADADSDLSEKEKAKAEAKDGLFME